MDMDEYLRAHPTDRFSRAIPLEEPEWERTLSFVGRIMSHAARVESILGTLAVVDDPGANVAVVNTEFDWGAHGSSGNPLIKALQSLAERSAPVKNVIDRYAAWAPIRNQIVHGVWVHEDHKTGAFELSKPNKGFHKKSSEDGEFLPFVRVKLDHAVLIEISYAFYGLGADAMQIQHHAMSGAPIGEWPFPNYAPESQWWPPGMLALLN